MPVLMLAAGDDQIVSNKAIEAARVAAAGPARSSCCVAARHEIMQERDAIREQFWAAFDAFVPGVGHEQRELA